MFSVINESPEREVIGKANFTKDGFTVHIFNSSKSFILKFNKEKDIYLTYVKVNKNFYGLCGESEYKDSPNYHIRFYMGHGRYALIILGKNSLNLNINHGEVLVV